MLGWVKAQILNQWADPSSIKPKQSWSFKDQCFYFNSEIGLIKYHPKSIRDMISFRDNYVNRMEHIIRKHRDGEDVLLRLKDLYHNVIRKHHPVYTATLRMRFRFVF